MNIVDRLLLCIYSLIVAVGALVFILFCLDFITIYQIEYWLVLARWREEVIAGCVAILLCSLRFIFISLKKTSSKERTISIGDDESSKITVKALTSFIEKSANQITALHNVKADIIVLKNNQIKINLSAGVLPDIDVLKISEQVKEKIQTDIQFTIGKQAEDIQILFNTIGAKQVNAKG